MFQRKVGKTRLQQPVVKKIIEVNARTLAQVIVEFLGAAVIVSVIFQITTHAAKKERIAHVGTQRMDYIGSFLINRCAVSILIGAFAANRQIGVVVWRYLL